jgi:hypothetical protein
LWHPIIRNGSEGWIVHPQSVAPLIDNIKEPDLWISFKTVLDYAGVKDTLLGSVIRDEARQVVAEQEAAAAREAEDADSGSSDDEDVDPRVAAVNWIHRLTDPSDFASDTAFVNEALKDNAAVRSNLPMLQLVQSILKQVPDEKKSTAAAVTKWLKDWLSKDKKRRLYEPLTITALKAMAVEKGIIVKGKKSDIIDELVKPESEQQQADTSRPHIQHTTETVLSSTSEK